MFDHEEEKVLFGTCRYTHREYYQCPETNEIYSLSHLKSNEFCFDEKYNCVIHYSTHTYTKGAPHNEIVAGEYNRGKVINIELNIKPKHKKARYDQYRFFSRSRYELSLDLKNLLDQCYNNQIRLNVESAKKNEYTAFPYLRSANDPRKNYCIFLNISKNKSTSLIEIRVTSAFIEQRDEKVKVRTRSSVDKIGLHTLLKKLNGGN
jgi:hypothetical protein